MNKWNKTLLGVQCRTSCVTCVSSFFEGMNVLDGSALWARTWTTTSVRTEQVSSHTDLNSEPVAPPGGRLVYPSLLPLKGRIMCKWALSNVFSCLLSSLGYLSYLGERPVPLVMSQRALTPQRFPELCFRTRRLFFFVCGRNAWLLSGEFIDTLETPSVGMLHSTGPLMSGSTSQLKCLKGPSPFSPAPFQTWCRWRWSEPTPPSSRTSCPCRWPTWCWSLKPWKTVRLTHQPHIIKKNLVKSLHKCSE